MTIKSGKVVVPLVEEYLEHRPADRERDLAHVHPSEMAKKDWCERATWYRVNKGLVKDSDRFSFTLQSVFDEGHQIHDKWQTWLKDTGKLWGDWKCRTCGCTARCESGSLSGAVCWSDSVSGDYGAHDWRYQEVGLAHGLITGHEDGAVGDRLIEFKSVGIGSVRAENPDLLSKFYIQVLDRKIYDLEGLWKALKAPLKSHVRQANIYMFLAQMMGGEYARFTKCSIVYEYKPNQQSREFVVPYSEEIVAPLIRRVYGLKGDIPPPCPYGGCRQCQAYEAEHPVRVRPVLRHRSGPGQPAGITAPAEAGQRDAGPTPRHNRAGRQWPDAAVPRDRGLAEISGDAARARRERRKVRHAKTAQDGDAV